MEVREFGKLSDGTVTHLYMLQSETLMCQVTDYGASLVRLEVPDRSGAKVDVVLGFDDVKGYVEDTASIGCNVGRCANRIAGASVELDGVTYTLDKNQGAHTLHSGFQRYSDRMWKVEEGTETRLVLSLESPHLDQGFPGNVKFYITYEVIGNVLKLTYTGIPDMDTVINFTNHSYFNLNGEGSGSALEHKVKLFAETFTPADATSVPTGEILSVSGTPMDFREFHALGERIGEPDDQLKIGNGYDHNFCLRGYDKTVRPAVEAYSEKTGIRMEVRTDLPGIQLYTANYLNQPFGRGGHSYQAREAVCFEPQFYPDAVHHENFPSPIVRKGETYHREIQYIFSTLE